MITSWRAVVSRCSLQGQSLTAQCLLRAVQGLSASDGRGRKTVSSTEGYAPLRKAQSCRASSWSASWLPADSAYPAVQGNITKGMRSSIRTAARDLALKTKKLVNALLPIVAAYESDDELADDIGPAQLQATADASEATADPVITDVSQTAVPPTSPPPPLPAEEAPSSPPPPLPTEEAIVSPSPPLPNDEAPPPLPAETPSPDPLPEQQQPAASKTPTGHRNHNSVTRHIWSISRKHTRSDPRGGSSDRSRRRRSHSSSPRRDWSPAARRRSSRARSRSCSPKRHRSRRVRSPSRRRHQARSTPPASPRRREGNVTEWRKGSSGHRDGRSGSHKGRGRSPMQQTPSETRQSSPSVQRRSDQDSDQSTSTSSSGPSSPESSPVPLRACGSTTLAMQATTVRPAASTPQTQLPAHDEAPTVEQSKVLSADQTAAKAVLSAEQQVRGSCIAARLLNACATLKLGAQGIFDKSCPTHLVCGKHITEAVEA